MRIGADDATTTAAAAAAAVYIDSDDAGDDDERRRRRRRLRRGIIDDHYENKTAAVPPKKKPPLAAKKKKEKDDDAERQKQQSAFFWGRFYVSPDADDVDEDMGSASVDKFDADTIELIRKYRRTAVEMVRILRALRGGGDEEEGGEGATMMRRRTSPRMRSLRTNRRCGNDHVEAVKVLELRCASLQVRIDRLAHSLQMHCVTQYLRLSKAFVEAEDAAAAAYAESRCVVGGGDDGDAPPSPSYFGGVQLVSATLHTEINYLVTNYNLEQLVDMVAATRELERAAVAARGATMKPMRLRVAELDTTVDNKVAILHVLEQLETLNADTTAAADYFKTKSWLDGVFRMPFGRRTGAPCAPISAHGLGGAPLLLRRAWAALEESTYGLRPVKVQIMQILARWIAAPPSSTSSGGALAFHGAPGTGKTSLARRGLCAALGRAFAFIPLGGASHHEYLSGHDSTYQGATWGRVAQALMECQCMNPVLYFDELDKIADSGRGKEVESVLMHVTDPSQNSEFQDAYFKGVRLPLDQCLTVFSYNDQSRVSPVLLDRLTVIHLTGYSDADKLEIAQRHLVPAAIAAYGFVAGDVVIGPDVLRAMIRAVPSEDGVRNLKRAIDAVVGKLNLLRLLRPIDSTTTTTTAEDDDVAAIIVLGSGSSSGSSSSSRNNNKPPPPLVFPYVVQPSELSGFLAHLQDASSSAWQSMFV